LTRCSKSYLHEEFRDAEWLGQRSSFHATGPASRTGDRLPHDELISILGSGGIESVYRAHDWRLRRDVAVKVLTPEAAAKPEMTVRFEREARAMAGRDNLWT
jgi:serine/threonine protein kinase